MMRGRTILFCFFCLSSLRCSEAEPPQPNATVVPIDEVCNLKYLSNHTSAQRACEALYSLQYNFYPSPISALYSYQTWNGFDGFWQNGVVLESLANWIHYGNNSMYKQVLKTSLRDIDDLLQAYYPQPSFDDMAWYGLSYLRIHEVLGSEDQHEFLDEAGKIFDWIWKHGWDHSGKCGGGVWFDQTKSSKQTIENVQMLQLGSKLYRMTRKLELIPKLLRIWKFIDSSEIINSTTYWVADGVSSQNCKSNQNYGPTYNMGVMIGGLTEYGQFLNIVNGSGYFLPLAHKIAYATVNGSTKNGVLVEWCSPHCNDDAKMFKGIFVRNLRYLIDFTTTHDVTGRYDDDLKLYRSFLQLNSDTAWRMDMCEASKTSNCSVDYRDGPSLHGPTVGPVFGVDYRGPYNYSAPMQQTSALDLFIASMDSDTKCTGPYCDYDPPIPAPPHHLTCDDDPCPPGEDCCNFDNQYYTCCEPTQRCVVGECI